MRFMLAQSPAQVPVKYVSVQCKGGLLSVLYSIWNLGVCIGYTMRLRLINVVATVPSCITSFYNAMVT